MARAKTIGSFDTGKDRITRSSDGVTIINSGPVLLDHRIEKVLISEPFTGLVEPLCFFSDSGASDICPVYIPEKRGWDGDAIIVARIYCLNEPHSVKKGDRVCLACTIPDDIERFTCVYLGSSIVPDELVASLVASKEGWGLL